jgi:ethanolamine utilization protein EutN
MNLARVIGTATASVKHASLNRWRMLIVQPLDIAGGDDGEPLIAIDNLGGRRGDVVMITSDGQEVRTMVGSDDTPVRWAVMGLVDEVCQT